MSDNGDLWEKYSGRHLVEDYSPKYGVIRVPDSAPIVDDEREALRSAVMSVLWNASNYPERAQAGILERDMGALIDKVTDAVLAVRRPESVTPETDQRILAWERIVWHPAFKPCFRDGKLIDHMMKRLDDLVELEATVNELAPAPVTPETETEWEYAIRTESTGKIEPDTEDGARWTAKYANIGAAGTETYTLMSRPVGPWLPVEDGGE